MRVHFEQPEVFAVKHKSDEERMASQSGGMFAVLSDMVLMSGGVVYGCVFDEVFRAIHIRADNSELRNKMRYSKYVQSDMKSIYKSILNDLEEGLTVLFSGTSCQSAGVNKYLEVFSHRIKGSFFSVDIVCHGVPSPRVWRDYLDWEKEKKNSGIFNVICRNKKKYGWKSHVTTLVFENGRKTDSRVFPRIFYSHVALRPACYKCPYKSILHPSDMTIADYWGIDKALPGFKDDKGVSLVLINTAKGKELFEKCKGRIIYYETRIEESLQKPLIEPYAPPANRDKFWEDYDQLSFNTIAKAYGNYNLSYICKWKIKAFISRYIKR